MNQFFAYIRQVIFVALLVQVAQMLVPDGEMRGYVRLVCGLLVLAVIVSPLVHLVPQLEGRLRRWERDEPLAGGAGVAEEAAVREGVELRETLTGTVYRERLSALMAEEIEALPGPLARDLHAEVAVEADAADGKLEAVRVGLREGPIEAGEEAGRDSIVAIPPVRIGEGEEGGPSAADEEVPGDLRQEIVQYLRRTYGLPEEKVCIFWMEGDDG